MMRVKRFHELYRKGPATQRLACSWTDPDQLRAMVLCAFGFTTRAIAQRTHLTENQVNYRKSKAGIKTSDYRNMEGGTVAGQIARGVMNEMQARYTGVVRDKLPNLLPTKKDTKINGHGSAPTLAHAGRNIRD
jgi:hypothetical protein